MSLTLMSSFAGSCGSKMIRQKKEEILGFVNPLGITTTFLVMVAASVKMDQY